jgi:hypothetical protein
MQLIKSNQDGTNELVLLSDKSEHCLKGYLKYMFKKSKIMDKRTAINSECSELTITTAFNFKIKYFIK